MMTAAVHIVHCIDTEGPLYESPATMYERLSESFDLSGIARTRANLKLMREGALNLNGQEAAVRSVIESHRSKVLGSWTELEAMLERVTAPSFRNRLSDSAGHGWIYNWFCMDHIGYDYNPRRRDIGYHNIFDYYQAMVDADKVSGDGLHWHFHPMSTYQDAHRCATHYFRTPDIFEILSRKVIERGFFPNCYRAGFQAERPDSHWFLEQWIPFDFSNMAIDDWAAIDSHVDFRDGRSGDWRGAPSDWSIYHPDHDDWRKPGACRRWIARTLNVLNRIASVEQTEMDKAFQRVVDGKPALVGICSHDWRDLGPEVEYLTGLVAESARRFPGVPFYFQEARRAFREVASDESSAPRSDALDLEVTIRPASADDVPSLHVRTRAGKVFGPQPFLAIELKGRRFVHDNLDFSPTGTTWSYAFHGDTLPLEDVARIGIAANDANGNTCVRVVKP
jgi:hypothetical protein